MQQFLPLLGTLAITVGILYLAYWSTKHLAGGRRFGAPASGRMRVLDRLVLGQDRQLIVIAVGERYFLLSSSTAGVQKIEELSAEEGAQWEEKAGDAPKAPSFLEVLEKAFGKKHGN